jgi:holo-[acyl-carrier protein] synthase
MTGRADAGARAALGAPTVVRGVGIDAVDIERFCQVLSRRPAVADRMFTDYEREDVARSLDFRPRLAARFAAKEAVMKALGVGIGELGFKEVEVRRSPSGAPRIVLAGRAAALAASRGVDEWHVSLTHTALVAVASVVAVGGSSAEDAP